MSAMHSGVRAAIAVMMGIFLGVTALSAADSKDYSLLTTCSEKEVSGAAGIRVEIYVPASLCCGGYEGLVKGLQSKKIGLYALDLTAAGKGKSLEPVGLKISSKPAGLTITQFTRGFAPVLVPRQGGTVTFDNRFASDLVCRPLFQTSRME